MSGSRREDFIPPANLPPGGSLAGRFLYFARGLADLQVASVRMLLGPWLARRIGSVLEVGCGSQPYRHLLPGTCSYSAFDWEGSQEFFQYKTPDTLYFDGGRFPCEDARFDALFHTEVLEHVWDFREFLGECRRVLKPGGSLFFAVPFAARWHYLERDFWRFTPTSLRRLCEEAGFKDVRVTARGTDVAVACYKAASVVFRLLLSPRGPLAMLVLRRLAGLTLLPLLLVSLAVGRAALGLKLGSEEDALGFAVEASAP